VTVLENDPTSRAASRVADRNEPTRQRAELYVKRGLQRQYLGDGGNLVQPSEEQKIWQQRMR
jgi:hypothetical protein